MRIASIAWQTVRWPIAGTGAARGRTERAAVLLEVRSDRGVVGLGEAAPVPGMSRDTLADAERAIATFAALAPFDLVTRDVPRRDEDYAPVERLAFDLLDHRATHTFAAAPLAARFAIETALGDALARELGVSLASLLVRVHAGAEASAGARAPAIAPSVPLAAVVDDAEAARQAFTAGIRCLKIKLGAGDGPDRVRAIAAAAPSARLRIDANRSWPPGEVEARLTALAGLPIDYVEEPCGEAHRLLSSPLPCRLALDESLSGLSLDDLVIALRSPALAALILKPTLLGGLSVALELAALARRSGVAAITSHTLEGPIGTAACAELALALGGDAPVGLAPHAALAGWSLAVAQLAADRVRAAPGDGLGFAGLDLAGVVGALRSRSMDGGVDLL